MCPSDDTPQSDRAAILARRERFIALALSGLATACSLPDWAKPDPCLDVKAPRNENREWIERERERQKQLEATPTPCLSPPQPEPEAKAEQKPEKKAEEKADPPRASPAEPAEG